MLLKRGEANRTGIYYRLFFDSVRDKLSKKTLIKILAGLNLYLELTTVGNKDNHCMLLIELRIEMVQIAKRNCKNNNDKTLNYCFDRN